MFWRRFEPTSFALAAAFMLATAHPVLAHPLGNFSINQYTGIELEPGGISIRYVIDMAEIPTFQEIRENAIVPRDADPSALRYLGAKIEQLKRGLLLEVNSLPAALNTAGAEITFPPGVGGLPTMRLEARLKAALPAAAPGAQLHASYRDPNFEGRAGWKEVVVRGREGTSLLFSSAPSTDRSQGLAAYPVDLLNSPPQDLEARFTFAVQGPPPALVSTQPLYRSSGPPGRKENDAAKVNPAVRETARGRVGEQAAAGVEPATQGVTPAQGARTPRPQARGASRYDRGFMELISLEALSPAVILFALLLAFALGAFHALEPGHGKTVVAAYLVGSRGTPRHALLLGLIVTASHTAGVYLLGLITLGASAYVVPERLYPWLGLLSGLAIVGLGITLLGRGWRQARGRGSGMAHGHAHGGLWHRHGPGGHHHAAHSHFHEHALADHHHGEAPRGPSVSARELLVLGITGGIIPCPAALVVLLGAVGLGRVGFGLLLIVAFSAGLALVLMGIGLLTVSARRLMSRLSGTGLLVRGLPVLSSAAMVLLGLGLTVQVLVSGGL